MLPEMLLDQPAVALHRGHPSAAGAAAAGRRPDLGACRNDRPINWTSACSASVRPGWLPRNSLLELRHRGPRRLVRSSRACGCPAGWCAATARRAWRGPRSAPSSGLGTANLLAGALRLVDEAVHHARRDHQGGRRPQRMRARHRGSPTIEPFGEQLELVQAVVTVGRNRPMMHAGRERRSARSAGSPPAGSGGPP